MTRPAKRGQSAGSGTETGNVSRIAGLTGATLVSRTAIAAGAATSRAMPTDAEAIGPVRRDVDVQHAVAEAKQRGSHRSRARPNRPAPAGPRRRIEAQFSRRAQHAGRRLAADAGCLDHQPAREPGTLERGRIKLHPRARCAPRIRCPTARRARRPPDTATACPRPDGGARPARGPPPAFPPARRRRDTDSTSMPSIVRRSASSLRVQSVVDPVAQPGIADLHRRRLS